MGAEHQRFEPLARHHAGGGEARPQIDPQDPRHCPLRRFGSGARYCGAIGRVVSPSRATTVAPTTGPGPLAGPSGRTQTLGVAIQVTAGAALTCSFGIAPSTLTAIPQGAPVQAGGALAATIQDSRPMASIAPFGMCTTPTNPQVAAATAAALGTLTPQPCIPVTTRAVDAGFPDRADQRPARTELLVHVLVPMGRRHLDHGAGNGDHGHRAVSAPLRPLVSWCSDTNHERARHRRCAVMASPRRATAVGAEGGADVAAVLRRISNRSPRLHLHVAWTTRCGGTP